MICSGVASPKFFGEPNLLILSEQQCFLWDPSSQSTKWQDMLEIWRGQLAPPCYTYDDIYLTAYIHISATRHHKGGVAKSKPFCFFLCGILFNAAVRWSYYILHKGDTSLSIEHIFNRKSISCSTTHPQSKVAEPGGPHGPRPPHFYIWGGLSPNFSISNLVQISLSNTISIGSIVKLNRLMTKILWRLSSILSIFFVLFAFWQDFVIVWQNTPCTVCRPAMGCLPHWCCWTELPYVEIQHIF